MEKRAAEARARHREKWLAYDEAARVCVVGEEYNMPDVQELRADRDAKKAVADKAQAEVDRLVAEGEGAVSLEEFLAATPAALQEGVTDATGHFALPPLGPEDAAGTASPQPEATPSAEGWLASLVTEGGATNLPSAAGPAGLVLLATVSAGADGQAGPRAWLYLLPQHPEDRPPRSVELGDADQLDLEVVRRFAGSSAP